MKQSTLYTKTTKTTPKDEVAKNAKLLMRAGFVNKEMAGVYSYLPLGLRVVKKIENLIREEMNAIGGQELLMSSLQDPQLWKQTNRWSDKEVDIWFKTRNEDFGLGNTHEEPITAQMVHHINSYKDLPVYVYQIQNKFRNEPRAKSGLLRGREFFMKDLYSFNKDEKEQDKFYEKAKKAYLKVFKRAGIGNVTYITFASGGIFSKYSHEFQAICEVGEDTVYLDKKKKTAVNEEVFTPEVLKELGLKKDSLEKLKSIEVGNIFKLGTRFSDALGLKYTDEKGEEQPVVMGSYGIGIGRLMAAVVEILSDEDGMVWPEEIAPFKAHLVELKKGAGKKLYEALTKEGVEVLYDDRDAGAGQKLKDADLIGIPWRLVVSEKTGDKVEVKKRTSKKAKLMTQNEILRELI